MYKKRTFLAIIPARGKSRRLPNKNILDLGGKPLVAWSIEAGLGSKYIDEVMVNTDSEEIIEISKKYGAKVPFKRPQELAGDKTSTFEVVKHTIDFYKNNIRREFDYIILLQPTSPLRDNTDIDDAIEFLDKKRADAVVSVCEMNHTPLWSNTLPHNCSMENFFNRGIEHTRSQDLPKYYRLNGAIYVCNTDKLLLNNGFFLKRNIFAYVMTSEKSIDIDTDLNMKLARILIDDKMLND